MSCKEATKAIIYGFCFEPSNRKVLPGIITDHEFKTQFICSRWTFNGS